MTTGVRRTVLWAAVLLAAASVVTLYLLLDPASGSVPFPRCPLKALTGWSCPGCGTQRALHAALHGDFVGALRYNLLWVGAIPLLVLLVVPGRRFPRLARVRRSTWFPIAVTAIVMVWWVVRNFIAM